MVQIRLVYGTRPQPAWPRLVTMAEMPRTGDTLAFHLEDTPEPCLFRVVDVVHHVRLIGNGALWAAGSRIVFLVPAPEPSRIRAVLRRLFGRVSDPEPTLVSTDG